MDHFDQAAKKATAKTKDVINCPVVENVSIEHKQGFPQEVTELKNEVKTLENKVFEKEPIRLNLDYSSTINMGNFESVKVSIGISIPVGQEVDAETKKQIDSTYTFASQYVEERIGQEIKAIEKYKAEKIKK